MEGTIAAVHQGDRYKHHTLNASSTCHKSVVPKGYKVYHAAIFQNYNCLYCSSIMLALPIMVLP